MKLSGYLLPGSLFCAIFLVLSLASDASGQSVTGTLETIHTFQAPTFVYSGRIYNADGTAPNSLAKGSNGTFYGTSFSGGPNYGTGTIFAVTTSGSLSILHNFTRFNDGYYPNGPLIEGSDGNFFGTTQAGGNDDGSEGYSGNFKGTFYTISTSGSLSTLFRFTDASFTSGTNTEGSAPSDGRLLKGTDVVSSGSTYQTFYGATQSGGHNGSGTIFKLVTDGTKLGTTLTTLYSFSSTNGGLTNSDGAMPNADLVMDGAGNIYGTTRNGGTEGRGTVFMLSGTQLTTLVDFTGSQGPSRPVGGLVQGADSNGKKVFYATSNSGGGLYDGTIFKVTTDGTRANTTVSVLYKFGSGSNGATPEVGLTLARDGNLYGTTEYTRDSGKGSGTIFQITPDGAFTSLHAFADSSGLSTLGYAVNSDGINPMGLVQGDDGAFYGATTAGGTNGVGTLFKLTVPGSGGSPLDVPRLLVNGTNAVTTIASGSSIQFDAVETTTPVGIAVRVQYSTDQTTWTDLPDGNSGTMLQSGSAFSLNTIGYPAGSVYFRAAATATGFSEVDSLAIGPFDLQPPQAHLSIVGSVVTTSDTLAGVVAHVGDDVTYTLTVSNDGQGKARGLKVRTTVPTYLLSQQTFGIITGFSFKTVASGTIATMASGDTSVLFVGEHLTGPAFFVGGVTVTRIIDQTHFAISSAAASGGTFTAPLQDNSGNPLVTLATGDTSYLVPGQQIVGGAFPPGGSTIAQILDSNRFTVTVAPNAISTNAIATTFQDDGGVLHQFVSADVTPSLTGTFINATTATSNDARILWDLGDLAPGYSQFVTFTVHLTGKVRLNQQIGLLNYNYSVSSSSGQPAGTTTGADSSAATVETTVRGPISFTMKPVGATVAPGGLITYAFTLTNLSSSSVSNAVAAVGTPDFTRFVGVKWANKSGGPAAVQNFWSGDAKHPQIAIDLGKIPAHGTVTFNVTFQAQWADPAVVPQISTTDYMAAFLSPDKFIGPGGGSTTEYSLFKTAFNLAKKTIEQDPGDFDFMTFLADTTHEVAMSKDDSGVINVALQGTVANQPILKLSKVISNKPTRTVDNGNGHATDLVKPGETITFILNVVNDGESEARDIVINDGLPDSSEYVDGSAKVLRQSKTTKNNSHPSVVVDDAAGHHIHFTGYYLAPHDSFDLQYSVVVDSGSNAPAFGTQIDSDASSVGSSSTPKTWEGSYNNGPILVIGEVAFAQPSVRPLVPSPMCSGTDYGATAAAMNAIYHQDWSTPPLPKASGSSDGFFFPDGTLYQGERYYVHYENIGKVAVNNVRLDVPLPAHTAFYRASFVTLPASDAKNELGELPGKLANPPSGASILPPSGPNQGFLANSGTATFTFSKLAAGAKGDVMVEVIVLPEVEQASGPLLGDPDTIKAHIYVATPIAANAVYSLKSMGTSVVQDDLVKAAEAFAPVTRLPVNPQNFPAKDLGKLGIAKFDVPSSVSQGSTFTVTYVIYNSSDVPLTNPDIVIPFPANVTYVGATYGQGQLVIDNPSGIPSAGDAMDFLLASNNGAVTLDSPSSLDPHTAAAITVTLKASGPVGSTIDLGGWTVARSANNHQSTPSVFAVPTSTLITSPGSASGDINNFSTGEPIIQTTVNGNDIAFLDISGARIVAQGGGNIVAQGGGNIVAQGGGNIVAQGGGNIVAQGGGNLVVTGPANSISIASTNASSVLAIVAQGGGNLIGGEGTTISVKGDAKFAVAAAAGGGNLLSPNGSNIVAQGGGNIVSQGAGNIVAQGGLNLDVHSGVSLTVQGGQIVSQGAGNIVAAGGGNIVAQGAGNIVAQGGLNLKSSDAKVIGSTPGSVGSLRTPAGHAYFATGGNFKPNP